jgi:hypothetical protein
VSNMAEKELLIIGVAGTDRGLSVLSREASGNRCVGFGCADQEAAVLAALMNKVKMAEITVHATMVKTLTGLGYKLTHCRLYRDDSNDTGLHCEIEYIYTGTNASAVMKFDVRAIDGYAIAAYASIPVMIEEEELDRIKLAEETAKMVIEHEETIKKVIREAGE